MPDHCLVSDCLYVGVRDGRTPPDASFPGDRGPGLGAGCPVPPLGAGRAKGCAVTGLGPGRPVALAGWRGMLVPGTADRCLLSGAGIQPASLA
jgi:hypothetical protein